MKTSPKICGKVEELKKRETVLAFVKDELR